MTRMKKNISTVLKPNHFEGTVKKIGLLYLNRRVHSAIWFSKSVFFFYLHTNVNVAAKFL